MNNCILKFEYNEKMEKLIKLEDLIKINIETIENHQIPIINFIDKINDEFIKRNSNSFYKLYPKIYDGKNVKNGFLKIDYKIEEHNITILSISFLNGKILNVNYEYDFNDNKYYIKLNYHNYKTSNYQISKICNNYYDVTNKNQNCVIF